MSKSYKGIPNKITAKCACGAEFDIHHFGMPMPRAAFCSPEEARRIAAKHNAGCTVAAPYVARGSEVPNA